MKKRRPLLPAFLFTLAIFLCSAGSGWSQTTRIEDFIRAGSADAEALTRAYLRPVSSGLGGGLNTGWFNSASVHKPLGFDITVRGALAFVPGGDQDFDLNSLNLQRLRPADASNSISPTASGSGSAGPEVVVEDQGEEVSRFEMPQGSGYHFVPSPMIQASVGLFKQTEIMVRFVPEVKVGKYGDLNVRGAGLKHSLSQWLPGGDLLPLDISVMAAFNRIDLNANLDLQPQQTDPSANYDNQKVETTFDTFSARLIVGKTLPFVSLYGAVGYETSSMAVDVTGNYPVERKNASGETVTETVTDPFSYEQNGDNTYSLTGGLRFNVLFFNIFGEYTLSKYSVANAGIGFSFR